MPSKIIIKFLSDEVNTFFSLLLLHLRPLRLSCHFNLQSVDKCDLCSCGKDCKWEMIINSHIIINFIDIIKLVPAERGQITEILRFKSCAIEANIDSEMVSPFNGSGSMSDLIIWKRERWMRQCTIHVYIYIIHIAEAARKKTVIKMIIAIKNCWKVSYWRQRFSLYLVLSAAIIIFGVASLACYACLMSMSCTLYTLFFSFTYQTWFIHLFISHNFLWTVCPSIDTHMSVFTTQAKAKGVYIND